MRILPNLVAFTMLLTSFLSFAEPNADTNQEVQGLNLQKVELELADSIMARHTELVVEILTTRDLADNAGDQILEAYRGLLKGDIDSMSSSATSGTVIGIALIISGVAQWHDLDKGAGVSLGGLGAISLVGSSFGIYKYLEHDVTSSEDANATLKRLTPEDPKYIAIHATEQAIDTMHDRIINIFNITEPNQISQLRSELGKNIYSTRNGNILEIVRDVVGDSNERLNAYSQFVVEFARMEGINRVYSEDGKKQNLSVQGIIQAQRIMYKAYKAEFADMENNESIMAKIDEELIKLDQNEQRYNILMSQRGMGIQSEFKD